MTKSAQSLKKRTVVDDSPHRVLAWEPEALRLYSVRPDEGPAGRRRYGVEILGSGFIVGAMQVEFKASQGTETLPVSNLEVVSDSLMTCQLDLKAATAGLYDLFASIEVESSEFLLEDDTHAELPSAFTVVQHVRLVK